MVAKLLTIQHRFNPLHVYCRFREKGLSRKFSISVCRAYELLCFMWVSYLIKTFIHCYLIVNRSSKIQDELRK
jgi:hypothetical protein